MPRVNVCNLAVSVERPIFNISVHLMRWLLKTIFILCSEISQMVRVNVESFKHEMRKTVT